MAKIAVDADGVLCRFDKAFGEMAERVLHKPMNWSHESTGWDDLFGLTMEEQSKVWDVIRETPNWWLTLDAFTENVGALARFLLTQVGHDLYIVTSRVPSAGMTVALQTDGWILACGVRPGPGNYLGVIAVEHWHDKAKLYKAMGIEWSVDDKVETVERCGKLKGHQAFLLDQPHNRDAELLQRIKTLDPFFDKIAGK